MSQTHDVKTIDTLTVIAPGDTPWSYSTTPGDLGSDPGNPWPVDEESLREVLRDECGLLLVDYWDRTDYGKGVWVILEDA